MFVVLHSSKLRPYCALLLMVSGFMAFGQSPAAKNQAARRTKPLAYEVVSVRPHKGTGWNWRTSANGYDAGPVRLKELVTEAYGLAKPEQISGSPNWTKTFIFDLEAKMDSETATALGKLPPAEQKMERRLMLQAILADRFQLRAHRESRQGPIYNLTVAKGGPKLKQSPANAVFGMRVSLGDFSGELVPWPDFVQTLSSFLDRPLLDRTGLSGKFGFKLRWTRDDVVGPRPQTGGILPPTDLEPALSTALQEQLGLKLQPATGLVETLVIDHLEMPSAN